MAATAQTTCSPIAFAGSTCSATKLGLFRDPFSLYHVGVVKWEVRKSGSPPIPKSALSHPLSYIPSAGVQPLGGYAVLTTAEPAPHPAPNSRSLRSRPKPEVSVAPPHKSGSHRRPSPPCGCGSQTTRLQPRKSALTLPRGSGSQSARPQPWKSADPGFPCCVRRSAFSVGDWQWSPSRWALGVAGPVLGTAGSGRIRGGR